MIRQPSTLTTARRSQLGAKAWPAITTRRAAMLSALAMLAFTLAGSVRATPVLVRIDDSAFGPPVIEVFGAPAGYNIYTGENVNNFAVEDGALITLLGVDTQGTIPDQGGRFVDPKLPTTATQNARDIILIEHDYDFFGTGDLRVGFNSAFKGIWYNNPALTGERNLGPVKPYWVTVFSNAYVIVQFKGPVIPGN